MSILEVKNLSISFNQYTKGLKQENVNVISSLHVELKEGEILAVVGCERFREEFVGACYSWHIA